MVPPLFKKRDSNAESMKDSGEYRGSRAKVRIKSHFVTFEISLFLSSGLFRRL
jgi:hypothetical protein